MVVFRTLSTYLGSLKTAEINKRRQGKIWVLHPPKSPFKGGLLFPRFYGTIMSSP